METQMTRIVKRALLIAALKEKWSRCYLIITDNHRKVVKKNTEHKYMIKKHKLDLNKKKTYILRTTSVRLLQEKNTSNSTGLRCRFFSKKNIRKKHLCRHNKNYYYFCKSNIPLINLIVGSRNMIKISKNISFKKLD